MSVHTDQTYVGVTLMNTRETESSLYRDNKQSVFQFNSENKGSSINPQCAVYVVY